MNNSLQQLNIQFDPIQDRLTLRILSGDNSEIRVWLTRRFTKLLLGVLDSVSSPEIDPVTTPHAEEMKDFHREAALEGSNFEDDYREESVSAYPLGESPVLVSRIDYRKNESGTVALTLGVEGGQNININLDTKLMHAMVKILQQGATLAEWELGKPSLPKQARQPSDAPPPAPDTMLH